MYRISRVRMSGVGPPDARFDQPAPDEPSFGIEFVGSTGFPEDTVVWLENGGGKTVFLTLLFHVLAPRYAPQIGNDRQGRRGDIGDFVQTGDVAHVAIEWSKDDAGSEKLITGLVAERRGSNINRTWYLLTLRDGRTGVDDLVFTQDGRRISANAYLESLEQLASRSGKTAARNRVELVRTSTQRKWLETLANHHLDPALFEYQVQMNKEEGGATSLFKFKSSEEFVEFFIGLTMNQETLDEVSQTLTKVAEKVAALPERELKLAHAKTAVHHLERISTGWARYLDAGRELTDAEETGRELYDQLAAAVGTSQEKVDEARRKVEEAADTARKALNERRDAEAYARQVAIAAADARITQLDTLCDDAHIQQEAAQLTADSWPRVAEAIRRRRLAGEIAELERAQEEAAEDAAPLFDRRDRLGRALAAQYQSRLDAAKTRLSQARSELKVAESDLHTANELQRETEAKIERAGGRAEELRRQVDEYERRLTAAVEAGVLSAGVEPQEALEAAEKELEEMRSRLQALVGERREEVALQAQLRQNAKTAADEARKAETTAERLRREADAAQEERDQLASHPLLADLGAEDVDLELVGSDVIGRVESEANRRSNELIDAAVETADDRRAVASLERDQLLPARPDVDALCDLLRAAGVNTAVQGWRYIAQALSPQERVDMIASNPGVVDGIVVAGNDLDQARKVLADAAPAAAVAVAATTVATGQNPNDNTVWVVPPDPAMYDPSKADTALKLRLERLETAEQRQDKIAATVRTARGLATALQTHLDNWPPGTLPAAHTTAQASHEASELARAQAEDVAAALTTAEAKVDSLDVELEELRTAQSRIHKRHSRLEHLSEQAASAATTRQELAEMDAARKQATKDREQAEEMAAQARNRRQSAKASIQTEEKTVDANERRLGELPDFGEGPTAEDVTASDLEARYTEAARLANEAITDSELTSRIQRLHQQKQQADEDWLALSENLRDRVSELMESDAATHPDARAAAEAESKTAANQAREQHSALQVKKLSATEHRNGLPNPERAVDISDLPSDVDELEALSDEAEAKSNQARDRRSQADEAHKQATENLQQAETQLERLETQLQSLASSIGDREPQPTTPFAGNAAEEVRRTVTQIRQTRERRDTADEAWREAASQAGRFARDEQWETLKGDLPRRLRSDTPEQLAAAADDLLAETRLLADRLEEEISKLDTHRQLLVTSLADAVSDARRSLNQAQSKSTLPSGLGEWSNHPFLKIRLKVPADRVELDARLRRFTNDLLEQENVTRAGLPTGALLIRKAVLACAEKTVTVDVLKPNKAQRLRYEPITEMATLSGGMRATAAIAMFCTLARVRATNQTGKAGVGTLILDNPIGDANATYLVNLQRQVARMSDVQLLYTTGVNDMDALRLFPNRVRLANEAAKRSHLAYVVADETFLKSLAPAEGDQTLVTGTRMTRRQDPLFPPTPDRDEK